MADWISTWSEPLNVGINLGMLVVWLVYLHVFVKTFRRSTRPRIIIARAVGRGLDSSCFVSNMSAESLYIENVIATVDMPHVKGVAPILDVAGRRADDHASDQRQRTHQGPLLSGEYISIGSFREIIERACSQSLPPGGLQPGIRVDVLVVADYASEELLIGASRTFRVSDEGGTQTVSPCEPRTVQITGRRERKELSRQLAGRD
ncbi:hypothetical protein J5J10_15370 [Ciceribacter sp. L1K23]|uniref:hypothetical protein n=1 Tax=Ciceribacter sp. L1K23 TaxID=2820276 RepID=UPI001B83FD18|nr:hypothetical protein [Ciceribacter sp. L1K23]MBR0557067.1 hypothetical protein [Ciceribacter sp. L1K23]